MGQVASHPVTAAADGETGELPRPELPGDNRPGKGLGEDTCRLPASTHFSELLACPGPHLELQGAEGSGTPKEKQIEGATRAATILGKTRAKARGWPLRSLLAGGLSATAWLSPPHQPGSEAMRTSAKTDTQVGPARRAGGPCNPSATLCASDTSCEWEQPCAPLGGGCSHEE